MALPRTTQNLISKGDFEALEDEWLQRMGDEVSELDYFVGTARALVGTDEEERARFLLGMLDEELRSQSLWPVRLKLLRRAGTLLLAPESVHPAILDTLRELYGDRPSFDTFVDAVGLTRAVHDLPKTWEKVERFESLVVFDVGSVVMMENRGVGHVVEVNRSLDSFKVDFEGFQGLTVGFRAAPKLLLPLLPGHVLRRRVEEPESLVALAREDPPELLHQVIASFARPLKAGEIRQALSGVVSDEDWTAWWAAARKHPHVVASGAGGRQTYTWLESSEDALEAVWRSFQTADTAHQIEMLRRDGGRDPKLRQRMAEDLEGKAEAAVAEEPGLAFEIWFALERSGGAPQDVPWAPDALLASVPPEKLLSSIRERMLRERGYTMYRERHDDWPRVYLDLLGREEDSRALDLLADGLHGADPKALGRFLDDVLTQPQKRPAAFVWMAERAALDEELRARNPLRLLQQILLAPGWEELKPWRVRLALLAESGGTLPRLLAHLSEDQAPAAEDAVRRAAFLESYQRDRLIASLHLRFSDLGASRELPLYATPASIEAKRAELQELISRELPANRKAIEEARALGDLRENFEYKSARQRHEYLSARATQLQHDLARVQPIAGGVDASEVRIGTRARLAAAEGTTRVLSILGPWESDPEADVISYQSELGQALLGKKPGDAVTVAGATYTVEGIEPWG